MVSRDSPYNDDVPSRRRVSDSDAHRSGARSSAAERLVSELRKSFDASSKQMHAAELAAVKKNGDAALVMASLGSRIDALDVKCEAMLADVRELRRGSTTSPVAVVPPESTESRARAGLWAALAAAVTSVGYALLDWLRG